MATDAGSDPGPVELWLVYHFDFSGIWVYTSEIDALRVAVDRGCQAERIWPGQVFGSGCGYATGIGPRPGTDEQRAAEDEASRTS